MRSLLHVAHIFSLAAWLGAVVMSGVVAAVVFPTMRDLSPTLPAYAGYAGEHGVLAAGFVAQRVFKVADAIQCGAGLMALASLPLVGARVAGRRTRRRRVMLIVANGCVAAAVGLLAWHVLILTPRMTASLDAFRAAAARGDAPAATVHRAAFNADHPTARNGLGAIGLLVAIALAAAALPVDSRMEPKA